MGDLLKLITRGLGLAQPPSSSLGGGGWHRIHEPFAGAWQRGLETRIDNVATNPTLFRCVTVIASDFAKLRVGLVSRGAGGVWRETESPAFSPVLRKPNRYSTRQQFLEAWQLSKQLHGNTYVLLERDGRNVVVAMYVLDPQLVKPLVAPDGSVFYQLSGDNLAGLGTDLPAVPAREIIHDRFNCLFHPLVGISPIHAAGLSALQGQEIQRNSTRFFQNGARPSGLLTAPGAIGDETAARLKAHWEQNFSGENIGRVAVLGDGLKYEAMTIAAVDAQLVEQLRATDERICSAFGVPAYMAGVGAAPLNNNVEALTQQYYSQVLQALIEAAEACLDQALGLPSDLGVEFDLSGLLRMDAASQAKALAEVVGAGIMSPNEARARLGLPPVKGGASPLAQMQNFSLEALAKRDAKDDPFSRGDRPPPAPPGESKDTDPVERFRPVMATIAAELSDRVERKEAPFRKRLEKLEADAAATRAQVNRVVKAIPSAERSRRQGA